MIGLKRIWVILGVVVCCVAAVCIWLLMSKEEMQPLPLPEIKQIDLIYYDGEQAKRIHLDEELTRELAQELTSATARVDEAWSAKRAKSPVVGLEIYNGMELTHVAYTNGHLIYEDDSTYRVKLDLESFVAKHDLLAKGEECHIYALQCMCWLARTENGWNADFMHPADEPEAAPKVIKMQVQEWTNEEIHFTITNEGTATWYYGSAFHLDVKIDGVWYRVPTRPGFGAFSLQATGLAGGQTIEMGADFTFLYGQLPPGTYRFIKDGVVVEHTLK